MLGKTVSHYRILEKLGAGGMGEVYRARDTKLDRDIALKVLSPEMSQDAIWRQRFEREAKAIGCEIFDKPFDFAKLTAWLDECEKRIEPNRKLSDWF